MEQTFATIFALLLHWRYLGPQKEQEIPPVLRWYCRHDNTGPRKTVHGNWEEK